jgi:hypothetical protein
VASADTEFGRVFRFICVVRRWFIEAVRATRARSPAATER